MKDKLIQNSLGIFRSIGIVEALSCIILFALAGLKRMFVGFAMAVKVFGWAHGILFLLYLLALLIVVIVHKWSLKKAFFGFIASLLPFGPFVFDAWLRKEEKSLKANA